MKHQVRFTRIALSTLTMLPIAFASINAVEAKPLTRRSQPRIDPTAKPLDLNIDPNIFNANIFDLHSELHIEDGYGEFLQRVKSLNFRDITTLKFLWSKNQAPFHAAEWRLHGKAPFGGDLTTHLASGSIDTIVSEYQKRNYFTVDLNAYLTRLQLDLHQDFKLQVYAQARPGDEFKPVTDPVGLHWLGEQPPVTFDPSLLMR